MQLPRIKAAALVASFLSSHREAPLIFHPLADNTGPYAIVTAG